MSDNECIKKINKMRELLIKEENSSGIKCDLINKSIINDYINLCDKLDKFNKNSQEYRDTIEETKKFNENNKALMNLIRINRYNIYGCNPDIKKIEMYSETMTIYMVILNMIIRDITNRIGIEGRSSI